MTKPIPSMPNVCKRIFLVTICIFWITNIFAQVGISTTSITPDASSILELRSTTLGFLAPRMTTTQRDAITSPATGLLIYNTTTNQLNFYSGAAWQAVSGGGQAQLNGTGFVKATGTTISYDNSTYITNANVVFNNQANSYTAGMKQTFQSSATTAGFGFGGITADPSSLAAGDHWYRSDLGKLFYRDASTSRALVDETLTQTLTNKDLSSATNIFPTFNQNSSGNAGSATLTGITNDNSTNATMYPTWVTSTSGNQALKVSSTKISFNPSTGTLTSTAFAGNLTGNVTGNASTVTTNANLTGDVTSVGNATTIGASKVTNAMLAGSIDLTTKVTGILPIANGGTNSTATPTNGGVVYGNGTAYQFSAAGTTGQVLTSNGTSAPTWTDTRTIVELTSDVINNNATANTIANVTGLSFAVTAGVTYRFKATIYYTAAATTTGSRWSISGPATPTLLSYSSNYGLTATTQTTNYASAYDIPAASNATSNLINLAEIIGIIKPSANGTVTVRFASEIANSAITAKAGSTLEWW